jgi:hypothetical protein
MRITDDMLSDWLLMLYGYTYPHWNATPARRSQYRI